MNRAEKYSLVVVLLGSIVADVWLFSSRCSASPTIAVSALSLGAFIQAAAIALPIAIGRYLSDQSPAYRQKCTAIAFLLFLLSLPVLQVAILYSDTI
jgi:hypothetical protein